MKTRKRLLRVSMWKWAGKVDYARWAREPVTKKTPQRIIIHKGFIAVFPRRDPTWRRESACS